MDDLWSASRRVLRPVVLEVESRGGLGENLGFQVDDNARGSCREFSTFQSLICGRNQEASRESTQNLGYASVW